MDRARSECDAGCEHNLLNVQANRIDERLHLRWQRALAEDVTLYLKYVIHAIQCSADGRSLPQALMRERVIAIVASVAFRVSEH
jgi:hypothetical protein